MLPELEQLLDSVPVEHKTTAAVACGALVLLWGAFRALRLAAKGARGAFRLLRPRPSDAGRAVLSWLGDGRAHLTAYGGDCCTLTGGPVKVQLQSDGGVFVSVQRGNATHAINDELTRADRRAIARAARALRDGHLACERARCHKQLLADLRASPPDALGRLDDELCQGRRACAGPVVERYEMASPSTKAVPGS